MQTQRVAFPEQLPRSDKRQSGRTSAASTTVNIRADKTVTVDEATREHIRARLGRQLGKFALRIIERTTVRFTDVNGPRGGVDVTCRIKVVLTGLPSVVLEERGTAPREAFDLAAPGVERAVRRALNRLDTGRTAAS